VYVKPLSKQSNYSPTPEHSTAQPQLQSHAT
jgi:hypothetical protein